MDFDERLRTLLSECRWVRDPALATSLVPSLATHAPPLVALPTTEGDVVPGIPVLCLPLLTEGVVAVISDAVAQGVSGKPLAAVEELDAAALREDGLTAALADLLAQASLPGLRSHVVPLLAVAWISQRVIAGRLDQLPGLSEDATAQARQAASAISTLDPAGRGACLRGVGFALASRVGAAANLAAMSGAPVQLGGLFRQLLPSPLVLAFPRGTLDVGQRMHEAAAMLDLSVSEAVLTEAQQVAQAVFTASKARADAGRLEPADAVLTHFFDEGVDPAIAAFHPFGGPALVGLAPVLGGKALAGAGLSRAAAKAYGSNRAARALAGVWRPFTHALATWDVLSRLVELVVPLRLEGGRALSSDGRLPVDARWPLLVPRPSAHTTLGAVAAVRLGDVLASVRVALGGRGSAWWSVTRAFHAASRATGASVRQLIGDVGVAAFPAPEHALRFADHLSAMLGPGASLSLGASEQELRIPESGSLGVGLSMGVIEGGTDGESSVLRGAAVAEAMALAGVGRADIVQNDPLTVRAAGWGPSGLHNSGVVASDAFVRSMVERVRKRNQPLHVRGEGGLCGGVDEDFQTYPVRAWWQDGEIVRVAVGFGGADAASDGAAELRSMTSDTLSAWRSSDRVQARTDRSLGAAKPVSSFGGGAEAGGMDQPSRSFFGLDDDAPRDAPAARPAPPVFQGIDDFGDGGDPGPGLHSFALEADGDDAPTEPADDPSTVDGLLDAPALMMLPDDEEDDGEAFAMPADEEDDSGALGALDGDPFAGASATQAFPEAPSEAPPLMMLEPEDDEDTSSSAMAFAFVDDDEDQPGLPSEASGGDGSPGMLMMDSPPEGPSFALLDDEEHGGAPPPTDVWDDPFASTSDSTPGDQAEYDGEMELVGVAGFTLAGDESQATGTERADPFFDPEEFTGFYDRRVGEVAPDPGEAKQGASSGGGGMAEEVARLLKGYVIVVDGDSFTFGLPDGALLRDAQTHDTAGDEEAAYMAFLQAKIQEGFVPRADRVVALVQGVRPRPVDPDRLRAVYGAFQ